MGLRQIAARLFGRNTSQLSQAVIRLQEALSALDGEVVSLREEEGALVVDAALADDEAMPAITLRLSAIRAKFVELEGQRAGIERGLQKIEQELADIDATERARERLAKIEAFDQAKAAYCVRMKVLQAQLQTVAATLHGVEEDWTRLHSQHQELIGTGDGDQIFLGGGQWSLGTVVEDVRHYLLHLGMLRMLAFPEMPIRLDRRSLTEKVEGRLYMIDVKE